MNTKHRFFLFLLLLGCAGCSSINPAKVSGSGRDPVSYYSQLEEPRTVALAAYARFRLQAANGEWDAAIASLEQALAYDPHSSYLNVLLAKGYLQQSQHDKASQLLLQLLHESPDDASALELAGDIAVLGKDYSQAVDYYRRTIAAGVNDSRLQLRLAMALSETGRQEEAMAVLQQILTTEPGSVLARLSLARLYANADRLSEAIKIYQGLLQEDPGREQIVLEYGQLLEKSDPDVAITFYLNAVAADPQAVLLRRRLGQLYLERKQFEQALMQYQEVRWLQPDNKQVIEQIGVLQLELENWTSAEREFTALLAEETAGADSSHYYLAMALAGQKRYSEAIAQLQKVLPDSPYYSPALLQLTYFYRQENKLAEAVRVLREAVEEHGLGDSETYYYLVAFLGEQDELEQALAYARAGVEIHPQDVRLLYQLGILYEKLARHDDAVTVMEQVLALDTGHAEALNFLAYSLAERKERLADALAMAQKAFAVKDTSYIRDTLGWIYFMMQRYQDSRMELEKAFSMQPDDPVILEHLGELYLRLNLKEQALEHYRRAVANDPDSEMLRNKLQTLEQELQK